MWERASELRQWWTVDVSRVLCLLRVIPHTRRGDEASRERGRDAMGRGIEVKVG